MTDLSSFLKTRRSVAPAMMSGPGPDEATLAELLTIAARVPDHGRLVPWRFVVFAGEARETAGAIIGAAFAAANPGADAEKVAFESRRLALAPVVVAVVSRAAPHVKIPLWEQELSAGAVCMTLLVAAQAKGFAAAWLTNWFAFDRTVLDAFGLAPEERIAGFIHIGRCEQVPPERERPDMAAIVSRFGA